MCTQRSAIILCFKYCHNPVLWFRIHTMSMSRILSYSALTTTKREQDLLSSENRQERTRLTQMLYCLSIIIIESCPSFELHTMSIYTQSLSLSSTLGVNATVEYSVGATCALGAAGVRQVLTGATSA